MFFLSGFLPWSFLSTSLNASTGSIVDSANLIKKVYFPREVLPISGVLSNLINFLISLIVLFALTLAFGISLSPSVLLLPVVILAQLLFVAGISFFLSTANVFYRDTALVMEVVMLAWFFMTPIFYSLDQIPRSYEFLGTDLDIHRIIYIVNPMASLVNMYRDMLYYGYRTDPDFFLRTTVTALVILGLGYWFFMRYSSRFGEEV